MRNLNDNQLALSVLISLGTSSGSGFIYRTNLFVYLVTAKHVLFDDQGTIRAKEIQIACQTISATDDDVKRIEINLEKTIPKHHYTTDIAIVRIGKVTKNEGKVGSFNYVAGVSTLQKGNSKPITVTRENIKTLEGVMISNDIYVFGYPTSLGIETSKQFDPSKPLLRKGIIANINKPSQTIILDCAVYGGNSGGPVIQIVEINKERKLEVIGIISQYIPYIQRWKNEREQLQHIEKSNSGYSVATSFDSVLELIEKEENKSS